MRRSFFLQTQLTLSLLLASASAHADMEPSFVLEDLAWSADEIVLASEGSVIDGELTVTETLRGRLAPNTTLRIPELAAFAPESARAVDCTFHRPTCSPHVSGARMLLFLRSEQNSWRSASRFGGFRVSVAWIEGTNVYAVRQLMNPGPQQLTFLDVDTNVLRTVQQISTRHTSFYRADALTDSNARANALATFVIAGPQPIDWLVRDAALRRLASMGPAAVPVLRRLFNEPMLVALRSEILRAYAQAAGPAALPDLLAVVTSETAFWRTRAPTLRVGWWNDLNGLRNEIEALRARYSTLYTALNALQAMHDPSVQAPVTALRDFWRSLPQLDDPSGLSQIREACEQLLRTPRR